MSQYFCHTCNARISRINDDFTCPTCSNGFIEEIEDAPNSASGGLSGFDLEDMGRGNPINPLNLLQFFLEGAAGSPRPTSRRGTGGGNPGSPASPSATASSSFGFMSPQGTPTGERSESQSDPSSRPRARGSHQFSFVYDPRSGGASFSGGVGGNSGENPTQQMFMSFLSDLVQGLGGAGGAQFQIGGPGVATFGLPMNLGDYVWGRDGLDAIVTQLMNNMEGTGPPPLSEDRLASLKEIEIVQNQVDAKLQCSVCWEDFVLDEKAIKLDCEHVYHSGCILPWLKLHGTCPVCRKDLNEMAEHNSNTDSTNPSSQVPAGPNPSSNSSVGGDNRDPRGGPPRRDFVGDEMEFD